MCKGVEANISHPQGKTARVKTSNRHVLETNKQKNRFNSPHFKQSDYYGRSANIAFTKSKQVLEAILLCPGSTPAVPLAIQHRGQSLIRLDTLKF